MPFSIVCKSILLMFLVILIILERSYHGILQLLSVSCQDLTQDFSKILAWPCRDLTKISVERQPGIISFLLKSWANLLIILTYLFIILNYYFNLIGYDSDLQKVTYVFQTGAQSRKPLHCHLNLKVSTNPTLTQE